MADKEVRFRIRVDSKAFRSGLAKAQRLLRRWGQGARNVANLVKNAFRGITAVLRRVGFAFAGLVAAAAVTVKAFATQQKAEEALSAALAANGEEVDRLLPKLKALASEIQNVTEIGDENILMLMTQLRNLGVTGAKMEEATRGAIGLSKALGLDLNTAARGVALALQGEFTILQRYIPALRTATTASEKMAILQEVMGKGFTQAKDAAQTLTGAFNQLKNDFGDLLEAIGEAISEGLGLTDVFQNLRERIKGLSQGIREGGQLKAFFEGVREVVEETSTLIQRLFEGGTVSTRAFQDIGDLLKAALKDAGIVLKNGLIDAGQAFIDFMATQIPTIGLRLKAAFGILTPGDLGKGLALALQGKPVRERPGNFNAAVEQITRRNTEFTGTQGAIAAATARPGAEGVGTSGPSFTSAVEIAAAAARKLATSTAGAATAQLPVTGQSVSLGDLFTQQQFGGGKKFGALGTSGNPMVVTPSKEDEFAGAPTT